MKDRLPFISERLTIASQRFKDSELAGDIASVLQSAKEQVDLGAKGIAYDELSAKSKLDSPAVIKGLAKLGVPLYLGFSPENTARICKHNSVKVVYNCLPFDADPMQLQLLKPAFQAGLAKVVITTCGRTMGKKDFSRRVEQILTSTRVLEREFGLEKQDILIDIFAVSIWKCPRAFQSILEMTTLLREHDPEIRMMTAFNNLLNGSKLGLQRTVIGAVAAQILKEQGHHCYLGKPTDTRLPDDIDDQMLCDAKESLMTGDRDVLRRLIKNAAENKDVMKLSTKKVIEDSYDKAESEAAQKRLPRITKHAPDLAD